MCSACRGPASVKLAKTGAQAGLNYRPIVAHLDHQLREDSESEAQFVRQAAAQLGLECVTEKAEVAAFAEHGASLEEAARILRYRFLVRVARDYGVNAIATGHTADDQAETVLMHFLRGAGPSGRRSPQRRDARRDPGGRWSSWSR